MVLVEGLRKAGKDLTRTGFVNAMEACRPTSAG
jgi:hypothetical protein